MHKIFLIISILFACVGSAFAQDGWVAAKVKQPARFTVDSKSWVKLENGMSLPAASWIHVGPRGRLILRRGRESIVYKSNTLAGLVQSTQGRKTEIRQQVGDLTVDVDRRSEPHVTVNTPFLAAVVKGTKFRTRTSKRGTRLKVNRGQVQVTRPSSGERTDINARQSVNIDITRKQPLKVSGPGNKAPVVLVAPFAAAIAMSEAQVEVSKSRSSDTARRSSPSKRMEVFQESNSESDRREQAAEERRQAARALSNVAASPPAAPASPTPPTSTPPATTPPTSSGQNNGEGQTSNSNQNSGNSNGNGNSNGHGHGGGRWVVIWY